MFRSIRNQILIPIVAIQGIAVAALALTDATLAARRIEDQIADRLNGVVEALGHANFPFTPGVLARMRGLSGAHFAAFTSDGRVTATTLTPLRTLPEDVRSGRISDQRASVGDRPTLRVAGSDYFAAALRSTTDPSGASLLVLYPEVSWRQARRDAMAAPLILGLAALGLMLLVTGWTARRIGRRVQTLQSQVARIADGEFEEFDTGRRDDEVRDLAVSMNRMCRQLNQLRKVIRQSERTRLVAQLAAGLAHQLRNSLTGARMSIQLHVRRFPPQAGDESLDVALRQLAITEDHVKGLLSLGRVERRPPESCDLKRLLHDVSGLVDASCRHSGVALDVRLDEAPIAAVVDASGVRAAVLNLVLNAIEAAGPGGRVGLEAFHAGGHVAIEVIDDGQGPPPGLADALCDAFVTSKPEGVGLGLAVVQQVASENGGRLSWSRVEGRETRFRLVLPIITAAREVAPA